MQHVTLNLGVDVGSITVKCVLVSSDGTLVASEYLRHGAAVRSTLARVLKRFSLWYPQAEIAGTITGSAALGLADVLGIPFEQEVLSCERAIRHVAPDTDAAIELGGEDAKVLYLTQGTELRMNEACAGGTGAFIDQMAGLLHTDASGLDELASRAERIHPIASRCGVFAKTDVVALLNEGASREDLAASVLQAVVEQTISGLACGRPIRGNVAFLGGPLHFLPQLRKRFESALDLKKSVVFEHGQFMVAIGAAMRGMGTSLVRRMTLADLARVVAENSEVVTQRSAGLPPLFTTTDEYAAFAAGHEADALPRAKLAEAEGDLFLGIDCGSTTVKSVLVDASGKVLDTLYARNEGNPLARLLPYVADLLDRVPGRARIYGCATTGYGAELAKVALEGAFTEVETVAHLVAACHVEADTDSLIDIGGQDMKYMRVERGVLADVRLNEACSSGCGAFLETFATGLGLTMSQFVEAALYARQPVDLGSRCTVFMNSKVKQAQKEGAAVADIAAGLCYAVVRNALYKVLRLKDAAELGEHVLVQGGTFLNDAVLRALELLLGRQVRRPDLAGHMGAYGAALLALKRASEYAPSALTSEAIRSLAVDQQTSRCGRCGNNCLLRITSFSNGRKLISGNRCERGAQSDDGATEGRKARNLYAWKLKHLFAGRPLDMKEAPRGVIGIPRVLNMFEHYPFWFALFTHLGFRVVLSPQSSKSLYLLGFTSMPSQTVCFPAKLVHGHVAWLIRQGVRHIFYPCMPWEEKTYVDAPNSFNCPVVAGYPDVIRLNTDELREAGVVLHAPFVRLDHDAKLIARLAEEFGLPSRLVAQAVKAGRAALEQYRSDLRKEAERILAQSAAEGRTCLVMAGRPYHADPFVNHGLPELAVSLGAAVITEDSVAHLCRQNMKELRVVDQWAFHSRLYRAAGFVAGNPRLELIQLTSFGCGLDAVTSDQVAELLRHSGRMHTLIKIDEGSALGAARIRLRSLLAAVRDRDGAGHFQEHAPAEAKPVFTRAMRATHTILIPQMAPIHFSILEGMFNGGGYKVDLLPRMSARDVELGLKYVHNDACYPAQVVIGQLIRALEEHGKGSRTAVALTQTCGPCRATNYPALLTKALSEAGFAETPILTMAGGHLRTNHPGFSISRSMMGRMMRGTIYGDMLQRLYYICRTHELEAGAADTRLEEWISKLHRMYAEGREEDFKGNINAIAADFASIRLDGIPRPRVGVVGEILMTYHPDANNHVADTIVREGGEPLLPDLMDFFLYCLSDPWYTRQSTGGGLLEAFTGMVLVRKLERLRDTVRHALAHHGFTVPGRFLDMAENVKSLVSRSHQAGEGWLLAAELQRLLGQGVANVLCLQPFGCLPNHITGRGVFKELKRRYAYANLSAVDYEPGSSEANQLNRIKLFLSLARSRHGV